MSAATTTTGTEFAFAPARSARAHANLVQGSPLVQGAPAPVAAPVRSRLRLTTRGRAVLTTLAALPLVAIALVMMLNGGGAVATSEKPIAGVEYEYVTIEQGESLWGVAEQVAPKADPRDFISDVLAFNGLASTEIFPGQRLALPTSYTD